MTVPTPPPSEQQVRDAIETVQSSYTYDPPSRWLEAHQMLRALRLSLQDQLRPYRWITMIGLALSLASVVALVWNAETLFGVLASWNVLAAAALVATALAVPGLIVTGSARLARAMAARRHPLVSLKDAVDAAAARFEDRYSSEHPGKAHDPA